MSLLFRRTLLFVLSLSLVALSISTPRNSSAALFETDPQTFDLFEPNSGRLDTFTDVPKKGVIAGFDFNSIDRSAQACQDFNRFANGGWMTKNPIPGAYSRLGPVQSSMNRM